MPATTDTSRSPGSGTFDLRDFVGNARWAFVTAWRTRPGLATAMAVTMLVRSLLAPATLLVLREVIDAVTAESQRGQPDLWAHLPLLVIGAALTIAEGLGPALERYVVRRLQDELDLGITQLNMVHAASLDIAYFEDARSQDVLSRGRRDTAEHFLQFVSHALGAGCALLKLATLTVILATIEPRVLLVVAALAPIYLGFQWRLTGARYTMEYSRTTKRRWAQYYASRLTRLPFLREVRLLGLAPLMIERHLALMRGFREEDRRLYRQQLLGSALFVGLATLAGFALLARVATRTLARQATVGDIVIFAGALLRLRGAVERTVAAVTGMHANSLLISNQREFLAARPSLAPSDGLTTSAGRGEIDVHDVHFAYAGAAGPTLNGVTLHVRPGETVALVGANGAGKTTLVKLLLRMYAPDRGRIELDGQDLQAYDLAYLQRQVAFVFQAFGRYEATAADNIAFGDWRHLLDDRPAIMEIARRAGVAGTIAAMPDGYDTLLGRQFGTHDLSGGEWQRLAIARALSRRAPLLILDEPTSNLDAAYEQTLAGCLGELARERTTLLISHRFSTIALADRILVMDAGRIVERGTHDELLASNGRYAQLYGINRRMSHAADPPPR